MQKREYAKTPLGITERKLTKIYDEMRLSNKSLPEDVSKKIYDIRNANEQAQKDYIDMTLKRDKKAVDDMLLESMTNELGILNNYLNQSTTKK